jgi:methionine-rich copper-binding protein CopC
MKKKLSISIFSLFLAVAASSQAFGHAGVVSTSPLQDQELTVMPAEISITFSEELLTITDQEVNAISLTAFDGPPIELTDINVVGAVINAQVAPGEYQSGTYEVNYKIVSADGHKVTDSFTFAVNAPLIAPPTGEDDDEDGEGVIPPPIVVAIAILIVLGGFLALRSRNRKN